MNAFPTNQELLTKIVEDYRPYDTLEAFGEGFVDYQAGSFKNRYECDKTPRGQVNAQAWDRGADAAMRYARAIGGAA
jgi:hypothetical protein